jgi:hypothetical protein
MDAAINPTAYRGGGIFAAFQINLASKKKL